jgi:hypothetical protein
LYRIRVPLNSLMLAELTPAGSASSAAAVLRRRIRDAEIAFWQARDRFASIVAARFPNYLSGHLYAELCHSRNQSGFSRPEADRTGTPNHASEFGFPSIKRERCDSWVMAPAN